MSDISPKARESKLGNVLAKPQHPSIVTEPSATVGVVLTPMTEATHGCPYPDAPARHPAPHQGYRYASIALTAIAGLMSILSIITASFSIYVVYVTPTQDEGDSFMGTITVMFQSLTLVESLLCMVAMATCFGLLITRPHAVLIRNPQNGSFICLCVSVFLMFLFSVYSFVVFWIFSNGADNCWPPKAMCVAPAVRLVALISFFAVLVANSKVLPHDVNL